MSMHPSFGRPPIRTKQKVGPAQPCATVFCPVAKDFTIANWSGKWTKGNQVDPRCVKCGALHRAVGGGRKE
jgi:hypothetical protein